MSKRVKSQSVTERDLYDAVCRDCATGSITHTATILDSCDDLTIVNCQFKFTLDYVTPLMIACKQNHGSLIKLLLAMKGINLNMRDCFNRTAAEYAGMFCFSIRKKIMRELMDRTNWKTHFFHITYRRTRMMWSVICEYIATNRLPGLSTVFECDELIERAIVSSTRLVYFSSHSRWESYLTPLLDNGSIISTDTKIAPTRMIDICDRNKRARHLCIKAALVVGGHLKRTQGRDMARLFMEWIWDTRGEKCWL